MIPSSARDGGFRARALARRQRGLSLVTILVALAVIGLLAVFAMPTYASYTRRVYISEGLELAMPAKADAIEYHELQKSRPPSQSLFSMSQIVPDLPPSELPTVVASRPSKRVEAVLRAGAMVMVSYDVTLDPNGQKNYYLALRPGTDAGATTWSCLSGDAAQAVISSAGIDMGGRLPMPSELAPDVCR